MDTAPKHKTSNKLARIPVHVQRAGPPLRKPEWIRVKAAGSSTRFDEIKDILRRFH